MGRNLPLAALLLLGLLAVNQPASCGPSEAAASDVKVSNTQFGFMTTVVPPPHLRLSGLRWPNHPDSVRWLEAYYAEQLFEEQQQRDGDNEEGVLQQFSGATVGGNCVHDAPLNYWGNSRHIAVASGPGIAAAGRLAGSKETLSLHFQQAQGLQQSKKYLIAVPVGDNWDPLGKNKWLQSPDAATFDIVAAYYGKHPEDFSCEHCVYWVAIKGGPFRIVYQLTQSSAWNELAGRGYEYVWLADDDLVISTSALNSFFATLKQHDIIVGQPSVCNSTGDVVSGSAMPYVHQRAESLIRYMSVVEIMGPAIRMDFFQSVYRHLINASHTGWGVDWLIPALLLYPRDRLAVVDSVCMIHPADCLGGGHLHPTHIKLKPCNREESTYKADGVPKDPLIEQQAFFEAFNFTKRVPWDLGYPVRKNGPPGPELTFGAIPNPRFRPWFARRLPAKLERPTYWGSGTQGGPHAAEEARPCELERHASLGSSYSPSAAATATSGGRLHGWLPQPAVACLVFSHPAALLIFMAPTAALTVLLGVVVLRFRLLQQAGPRPALPGGHSSARSSPVKAGAS